MLRRCKVRLLLTQLRWPRQDATPIDDEVVETDTSPIVDEVVETDATHITNEIETDVIPITIDAETTDVEAIAACDIKNMAPASMEPSVHTNREFPGGPSDRSVLIEYVDYVAY
ncbi:unnamed protein product [Vicia faba]|uniref:Uncharacterized protein n=1 Tax=Vicia faba TaxID=3906 RepID=A0AAV0YRZ3_VICFA|nr:unnamed protein product [Vicia faba]